MVRGSGRNTIRLKITTREASVAAAEGKATSFKRRCRPLAAFAAAIKFVNGRERHFEAAYWKLNGDLADRENIVRNSRFLFNNIQNGALVCLCRIFGV